MFGCTPENDGGCAAILSGANSKALKLPGDQVSSAIFNQSM
jgi:hypothetical protein